MGNPKYKNEFKVTLHPDLINVPLQWKKPAVIFVNSMSDLFHEEIPESFIANVFNTMNRAYWHIFQVLTKRSERLKELASRIVWTPNIWMGVTVELEKYYYRIEHLSSTPAMVKFISLEPMLGPMPSLPLDDVDWVIVGGESGPKARKMNKYWVYDVMAQCRKAKVPFFFKQWGGNTKNKGGKLIGGKVYHEYPSEIKHLQRKGGV